jgi:hypothetical protein
MIAERVSRRPHFGREPFRPAAALLALAGTVLPAALIFLFLMPETLRPWPKR